MSTLLGTPTNFNVQSANQQILLTWDLSAGADSYIIQRSQDNVAYSTLATVSGSPLATSYLDTALTLGIQYYYKVCAASISTPSINSPYTSPQAAIATPVGEYTLGQLRLQAQQKADRVSANFVSFTEWNSFINRAYFELYDLLVTVYEDYFIATPVQFQTDGSTQAYPLPNGQLDFLNGLNPTLTITKAPAFYKLIGIDLAIQSSATGYVTVNKFNFIERNRFVYPNSASTIYGVFNCQYRVMGNNIEFIPTPSGNQSFRVWYVPRLTMLLQDTDTTVAGISGWTEYIVTRAAIYALNKEESDTALLTQELAMLKQRIEETAANRDIGQPDKISDTRCNSTVWGGSGGPNWSGGGF